MDHYYNFASVLERVPSHIEAICNSLYPEGKKKAANWCVADLEGGPGQSFQISLKPANAGCYIDRTDPSINGNAIGLVALKRNISYQDAGEWLAKFVGVGPEERISTRKKNRPKPKIDRSQLKALKQSSIDYAASRSISEKVLRQHNIASADRAIAMPHYNVEGEVTLVKFWPTDGSKDMWTNKDPIQTLFGKSLVDPIKTGGRLIITEGQWDSMSWVQIGYPAVSIPGGVSNDQWIEEDWTFLNQFTDIFLDFDNDIDGREAEARVRLRLGYDRCRSIRYEQKDANEVLQLGKPEILTKAYEEARDAPVEHIIIAKDIKHVVQGHLSNSRESTGVPFFLRAMNKLEFRPHEMTLWFGHTGHGKSTMIMNQFAYQAGLGRPGMIASFEDTTSITYATLLKQFAYDQWIGSREEFNDYYDRLTEMVHLFDSMKRTEPEVIVSTMTLAHKQLGICDFAIDNVMTLECDRQDNTQQAKIADAFRIFVSRFPVHLHLAAHPRKSQETNIIRPPQIGEVRGASEWGDMAQNAICVYRDVKKGERVAEMHDEGLEAVAIAEYKRSCRDGKILVRKQRTTGDLPICSFMFEAETKRFWKDQEEKMAYWTPPVEEPVTPDVDEPY